VRVADHPAAGGLAEHLGQPHHRRYPGGDDVDQHLAGADGGKRLVDRVRRRGTVCHAIRLGEQAPALVPDQLGHDIRGMANRLRHAHEHIGFDRVRHG
jgi:hypothetical protein